MSATPTPTTNSTSAGCAQSGAASDRSTTRRIAGTTPSSALAPQAEGIGPEQREAEQRRAQQHPEVPDRCHQAPDQAEDRVLGDGHEPCQRGDRREAKGEDAEEDEQAEPEDAGESVGPPEPASLPPQDHDEGRVRGGVDQIRAQLGGQVPSAVGCDRVASCEPMDCHVRERDDPQGGVCCRGDVVSRFERHRSDLSSRDRPTPAPGRAGLLDDAGSPPSARDSPIVTTPLVLPGRRKSGRRAGRGR